MTLRRIAGCSALLAALALGCGDPVCDSGATQACTCPGGAAGARTCLASGDGWGSCDCDTVDAGPLPDAGPAADAGPLPDATAGDDASTVDAGSDAGPPDRCTFAACGGDATGTWDFAAVCRAEWVPSCTDIVITSATYEWPQTLDLRGDGTFTWERMSVVDAREYTVPASCIDPGTTSCSDYASSGMISTGVTTCTGDVAVECSCRWRRNASMPDTQTGTWSQMASQITLVPSSGMMLELQFCVDGDWLQFLPAGVAPTMTRGEHTFVRR